MKSSVCFSLLAGGACSQNYEFAKERSFLIITEPPDTSLWSLVPLSTLSDGLIIMKCISVLFDSTSQHSTFQLLRLCFWCKLRPIWKNVVFNSNTFSFHKNFKLQMVSRIFIWKEELCVKKLELLQNILCFLYNNINSYFMHMKYVSALPMF